MANPKTSKFIFVCTGKKCKKKGSKKVYKALKQKHLDLLAKKGFRISKSSCLDECKSAPNIFLEEKIISPEALEEVLGFSIRKKD